MRFRPWIPTLIRASPIGPLSAPTRTPPPYHQPLLSPTQTRSMDYRPRYKQPFSLAEAVLLDVGIISEEIERLDNSIRHLKGTQIVLLEVLQEPGEPDPEIARAYEENQTVIGSQEERISILKLALTQKGIGRSSHYDQTETMTGEDPQDGVYPDGVYL